MFGYRVLWSGNQAGGSGGIQSPIHAWNLDSSPWEDAIAAADLTVSSGIASSVPGKITNGLQLSGANFLQSAIAAVPSGDVSFTFGIWVYLSAGDTNYKAIASLGNDSVTDEWQIFYDDGFLFFYLNSGESALYDLTALDQWHYIKVKRDKAADTMAIALNNDLVEWPGATGSITPVSNPRLRIGRVTRTTAPLPSSAYASSAMIFDGAVYYAEYVSSGTDDLDWNLGDGRAYP